MRSTGPASRRFLRLATLLGFAVGLSVICGASSPCSADLIIPQPEPAVAPQIDFVAALADPQPGAGSSEDRGDNRERPKDSDGQRLNCGELLGDAAGGASSPDSGSNGSTFSTSAASHALPPATQPPAVLYAHWREVSPSLPRPPSEELLDPPKSRS